MPPRRGCPSLLSFTCSLRSHAPSRRSGHSPPQRKIRFVGLTLVVGFAASSRQASSTPSASRRLRLASLGVAARYARRLCGSLCSPPCGSLCSPPLRLSPLSSIAPLSVLLHYTSLLSPAYTLVTSFPGHFARYSLSPPPFTKNLQIRDTFPKLPFPSCSVCAKIT